MIRSLVLMVVLASVGLLGCSKEVETPQTVGVETTSQPAPTATAAASTAPYPRQDNSSKLQVDGQRLSYVGSQQCGSCHAKEMADWKNSHHDLAMQTVSAETMLGDFNNSSFDYFGTVSQFYRKGDDYFVKTDGPDGALTEYRIAYTFGVYPLQQYLIEFPGGRLQALNIVWDSRPAEEGGQRWYHLYPDEQISSGDELHWTGINHNWNYMCADCHSTNLKKNYDLLAERYHTSWSEIDVGCEACHGPASLHVEWAQGDRSAAYEQAGFPVAYHERDGAAWHLQAESGNSVREPAKATQVEIDSCGRCHARRGSTADDASPADALIDHYQLALLRPGLYHSDGQIDGEVYVYGSFLQSRMYQAGVTCSDCHNPHSLQVKAEGNSLCAQCHAPTKYDRPEHHFHPDGSSGAQCVSCHMPTKTYMGVDARRDHSFRIPRPDLSQQLGTPNACSACHTDKSAEWAATELTRRGKTLRGSEYAVALHAGRMGWPQAETLLAQLVMDATQPDIARATAVTLLPQYLSQNSAGVLQMVAQGDDHLLSYALSQELQSIAAQYRPAFAVPLLYEQSGTTRELAARSLVGLPLQQFPPAVHDKYALALKEYEAAESFNADRPESLANLAGLYAAQGQGEKAAAYYRRAVTLAPYFTPAWINLADLYQQQGDESRSRAVLQEAMAVVRDPAPLHHALGLALVRSGQQQEALQQLALAAAGEQAPARYLYVYGVALNSLGQPEQAVAVLEEALQRYPGDREIVSALYAIHRDRGDTAQADKYRALLPGQ